MTLARTDIPTDAARGIQEAAASKKRLTPWPTSPPFAGVSVKQESDEVIE